MPRTCSKHVQHTRPAHTRNMSQTRPNSSTAQRLSPQYLAFGGESLWRRVLGTTVAQVLACSHCGSSLILQLISFATVNAEGVNELDKRDAIERWMLQHSIHIVAVQETKCIYSRRKKKTLHLVFQWYQQPEFHIHTLWNGIRHPE